MRCCIEWAFHIILPSNGLAPFVWLVASTRTRSGLGALVGVPGVLGRVLAARPLQMMVRIRWLHNLALSTSSHAGEGCILSFCVAPERIGPLLKPFLRVVEHACRV